MAARRAGQLDPAESFGHRGQQRFRRQPGDVLAHALVDAHPETDMA